MLRRKKKLIILLTVAIAAIISLLFLLPQADIITGKNKNALWGYYGDNSPENWGKISEDFALCASGTRQSPVNVLTSELTAQVAANSFLYKYQDSALAINNKGKTIQIHSSNDNFIKIGPKDYKLLQYHFHAPAEFTVDGKVYPMSVDFVHADADSNLTVVNVFFEEGEANPIVELLWQNIPKKQNKLVKNESVLINALKLLPDNGSYYQFHGSLTTPPCSENVLWNLLTTPITASKEQIDRFVAEIGHNARPVQPLNGRPVVLVNTGNIVK